jgi:hypothetical protein
MQNPYASFTTIGTNPAPFDLFPPEQAPIVLQPSSYDLSKDDPDAERCFTIILLCGSVVLVATVGASIGLVFGFL